MKNGEKTVKFLDNLCWLMCMMVPCVIFDTQPNSYRCYSDSDSKLTQSKTDTIKSRAKFFCSTLKCTVLLRVFADLKEVDLNHRDQKLCLLGLH